MRERYNFVVKLAPILLILVALCAACNRTPHSNAAIKQGIIDHLSKGSGLNLSLVDVEVTNVAYQGDKQAIATVFFRPKGNPEQGMSMNYTLEAQGNKWVVTKRAGGAVGSGDNPHGGGATGLPPGHPSLPQGASGASGASGPSGTPR